MIKPSDILLVISGYRRILFLVLVTILLWHIIIHSYVIQLFFCYIKLCINISIYKETISTSEQSFMQK